MSLATVRAETRFWLNDPAVYAWTDAEIDEFLKMAVVNDADGYHPMQTNYTPTWDVFKAAAYGWLKMAGFASNKPLSYSIGDLTINVDNNYCLARYHDLMGAGTAVATRRDEPWQEIRREKYYDGDDPRHRS